jgi:hypothetical protein
MVLKVIIKFPHVHRSRRCICLNDILLLIIHAGAYLFLPVLSRLLALLSYDPAPELFFFHINVIFYIAPKTKHQVV